MGLFEDSLAERLKSKSSFGLLNDRRKSPRAPTLRGSYTAMTAARWDLELVPALALDRLQKDIESLASRSLEPNIFFNGMILRAAWPRLTSVLAPQGCWMLCLWETLNDDRQLRAFFPIGIAKVGWPSKMVLSPLANSFMPIGTPLLDESCAEETAETLLRLLGDRQLGLPNAIDFTYQRESGPTIAAIRQAAKSLGLVVDTNNAFQRAALVATDNPESMLEGTFSKKRLRELARQMRMLEETGDIAFVCSTEGNDVLDTFERFMTLELRSWKGQGGSALFNHKRIASFSRQIVAELAAQGLCQIYWLKQTTAQESKMIAGVILLGSADHLVPWKMTFDETQSQCSPGMQVMVHATQKLLNDPEFIAADSLAAPDHWMMNRLWADRINICDVTIGLTPQGNQRLRHVVQSKQRRLRTILAAKRLAKSVKALSKRSA